MQSPSRIVERVGSMITLHTYLWKVQNVKIWKRMEIKVKEAERLDIYEENVIEWDYVTEWEMIIRLDEWLLGFGPSLKMIGASGKIKGPKIV